MISRPSPEGLRARPNYYESPLTKRGLITPNERLPYELERGRKSIRGYQLPQKYERIFCSKAHLYQGRLAMSTKD